jgi:hypothetical protein
MSSSDDALTNQPQEDGVESPDSPDVEAFHDWNDYKLDYNTTSPGAVTKGFFKLTLRGGAVFGTRTKTEHNGNPITPETHPVEGFLLNGRLKLYREIPSSNVVQIYDVNARDKNRFDGRYYNIGANNDAGQINMFGG